MTVIAVFVGLVVVCILAAMFGEDSRFDRPGRQL